jgi:hypothetical protein
MHILFVYYPTISIYSCNIKYMITTAGELMKKSYGIERISRTSLILLLPSTIS